MPQQTVKAEQFSNLIPNNLLGSDVPRPNLLQNGGFEQWHYGVSFSPTSAGAMLTADNWIASLGKPVASCV